MCKFYNGDDIVGMLILQMFFMTVNMGSSYTSAKYLRQ